MSEVHSTHLPENNKPAKPSPDFPLFAHAAGVWAKKIRGKMYYFGPWSDPDKALDNYLRQKDALHAGRKLRPDPEELTVKELVNGFLNPKTALKDTGELSPRTWEDYKVATDELISRFGKNRVVADLGPDDFAGLRNKMAKQWGPHRLGKTIQCVRSVFKYGFEAGLIDKPMRFGPGFARPSKKTIRLERAKQGAKLFTADEIRRMLDAASSPMKAMIFQGSNAALGNGDCGTMPLSALNLETGWLDFPRPKTGIPRRCPLWPETVEAISTALAKRPEPKKQEHAALVFVTQRGPASGACAGGSSAPWSWEAPPAGAASASCTCLPAPATSAAGTATT
jgi:integrase